MCMMMLENSEPLINERVSAEVGPQNIATEAAPQEGEAKKKRESSPVCSLTLPTR